MAKNTDGLKFSMVMEELNLFQEDIGVILGKDQSTISRYKSGAVKIPNEVLKTLHLKLKVNINWWYTGVKPIILGEIDKKNRVNEFYDIIVSQEMILAQLAEQGELLQKLTTDFYAFKHGVS